MQKKTIIDIFHVKISEWNSHFSSKRNELLCITHIELPVKMFM